MEVAQIQEQIGDFAVSNGWDFELLKTQKPDVAEAMIVLGNAGPTVNARDKTLKGYQDGKVYYSSDDLVRLANGLIEAAKWLDLRAMSTR